MSNCNARWSHLAISIGLLGVALVVPVLEVLVDGSLLRSGVFPTHGRQTTTSLGGLAVQGLVESSIARDILALKSSGSHGELEKEDVERVLKGGRDQEMRKKRNTGLVSVPEQLTDGVRRLRVQVRENVQIKERR